MKKLIIIVYLLSLILAFNALILIAQDAEPKELIHFNYKYYTGTTMTPVNDILKPERFQMKNFLLGWHWGAHPKMTESLGMNMIMNTVDYMDFNKEKFNYTPNTKIHGIMAPYSIELPWYAQSFQYEPTLLIPPNQEGRVNKRSDESVPSIFGFETVNITPNSSNISLIPDPYTNKNKYCLKINNSDVSFDNDDPVKILEGNWPNDNFRTFWNTKTNIQYAFDVCLQN